MSDVFLDSAWGPAAIAVLVGCLMLAAALVATARPRGAWLRNRIGAYDAPGGGAGRAGGVSIQPQLERLLGATERRLDHTKAWRRLELLCDRAHSNLRPSGVVYLSGTAGLGALLLALLGGLPGLAALLLALVAGAALPTWLSLKGSRRLRAFDDQLPDVLMTIAGSLRVGHSFEQGVKAVVDRGIDPASTEFDRMLGEMRLGRTMDEAFQAMADRIGSADLEFVLLSVRIQKQVGGSLADLFETVATTVRERQQFRRRVRALTAQGRMSATILIALPFLCAAAIALLNPGYLEPMVETSGGLIALAVGLGMIAVGALVLRRIANVKE